MKRVLNPKLLILLGAYLGLLGYFFVTERDFAVHSDTFHVTVEGKRSHDGGGARDYHVYYEYSYIDPRDARRRSRVIETHQFHTIAHGGRASVGDVLVLRRDRRYEAQWRYGYWYTLYDHTLFLLLCPFPIVILAKVRYGV